MSKQEVLAALGLRVESLRCAVEWLERRVEPVDSSEPALATGVKQQETDQKARGTVAKFRIHASGGIPHDPEVQVDRAEHDDQNKDDTDQ